jgi:colanic acid/amylovoran biosynthesis glycosyltransferase
MGTRLNAVSRRRIAYVASAFPCLTETFVLREVRALEQRGWDVTVFALKRPPHPVLHDAAQRWRDRVYLPPLLGREVLAAHLHYLVHAPSRLLALWAYALWWNRSSPNFAVRIPAIMLRAVAMARVMERCGIAHVHAHFATHPAMAALVAAALSRTSFSVTAHAHDLFVRQTALHEKLRCARFVACISDFNRRFLLRRYPDLATRKLVVVRCGVDVAQFHPAQEPGKHDVARLLCVASLQEYKGLHVLVEACAQLRERLPIRCTLVGEGPFRDRLEARVRELGLGDRVHFLGPVSEERVGELLREADIFVAPSVVARDGQMDGIPVALMEALAAGVPVVASDLSGIPELVVHEQTGLLVPPGDATALAAAIERLARDPTFGVRLGRQGREHVSREFLLETNVARIEALFAEVLHGEDTPLELSDRPTPYNREGVAV